MKHKVISTTAYEKKFALEMILAARRGDYRIVNYYITENKYLVYDFDHVSKSLSAFKLTLYSQICSFI